MFLPKLSVLWIGIRPKTLSMSLMPVLAAFCFAYSQQHITNLGILLAIALGAVAIQIATNLFNDAQDFLNGTDTTQRIGPQRITQAGLASVTQTRMAAFSFIGLAAICGSFLIWQGGWLIGFLGALALICAYGYSHGPWPISRGPFGELFVLAFFGIMAFNVSYFLLSEQWPVHGLSYGIAIGTPACAILLLNNYRDLENDRIAGRRTLAILLGPTSSKIVFCLLMACPYILLFFVAPNAWFLLGLPLSGLATLKFLKTMDKSTLNANLGICAASQILLCLGLSIGFLT